jgi:ubiquinone/menaquinone biosynthesis C-methylase UbiE
MKGRENLRRSAEHYAHLAERYDRATRLIDAIRLRTIAALQLRSGDVVIDAGCGTGWCIPHLAKAVGPAGQVIGFDPSPDMLAIARERVDAQRLTNVVLIDGTAGDVGIGSPADAILFSYTHDLIQSPEEIARVLQLAKPGARVAATSTKLYAKWLLPLNAYLRYTHRHYITNFERFDAPWRLLATCLADFSVKTSPFTQHYVATGLVYPRSSPVPSHQAA